MTDHPFNPKNLNRTHCREVVILDHSPWLLQTNIFTKASTDAKEYDKKH